MNLVFLNVIAFAQTPNSISEALAKAPNDSARVRILAHQSETAADGVWESYTVHLKALTEKKLAEESVPRLRKYYAKYLAVALNNLALDESNKGRYISAENYWEESQRMAREAGDPSQEAIALSNLCRQYYNGGQLQKALDGFHRALNVFRATNEKARIATSLNYLGDVYRTQHDLPNAYKSYTEALQILESINDRMRLADSYNRLGMIATMENDESRAVGYYTKALNIYEQKGFTRGVINMQFQLGKLMQKVGKLKESLPYFYETLAMLKKTEQNYILMNCLSSIGQVYYLLGQPDSASQYFNRHILIDKDFKYPDILIESTKLLYRTYKQQGKDALALGAHELYFRATDSIFNDKSRKAVLKSQYKYEYDKKALVDSLKIENEKNILEARRLKTEAEKNVIAARLVQEQNRRYKIETEKNLAEARRLKIETEKNVLEANLIREKNKRYTTEVEKKVAEARRLKIETEKNVLEANLIQAKNQRYALMGGVLLLLLIAGFAFSQFRVRKRLEELKLRNQIASDLHDEVGSAISSISLFAGMARMKGGSGNEELVEKIEETSRETINTMSDIVWSIEPANDTFQNVLRKMKQFGEQLTNSLNIKFQFTVQPGIEKLALDMKQRKNIYLIYKEAVNNSCKHAKPTEITVVLRKDSGTLEMIVSDNGQGFDVTRETSGYGTSSMKTRSADLNGRLEITSSARGTTVALKIP